MPTSTVSADAAVAYLKAERPLGGWSVESKNGTFRLLRRKIPVTDSYFLDIYHDPASDCVVGILARPKVGKAQGQVLIDEHGKPTTRIRIVSIASYDPYRKAPVAAARSSATASTTATNRTTTATNTPLTVEQNKQLMTYAGYFIGSVMILRIITKAMFEIYLLLIPLFYLYALQSCPSETSFDAKKELRRILRGHHLPENHRDKPRGWLDETMARVSAAVTTELATGLGYEVTMMSILGAAWFTSVRVPTNKMDFYWIGVFDRWIYVYAKEYEDQS